MMENERISYSSLLDEKREISKSFPKSKFQISNQELISNYYQKINNNNNNNNNKTNTTAILSPIDVNTPKENNNYSYHFSSKSNSFNNNNTDNDNNNNINSSLIRKRKPIINQNKLKKQKIDDIHQNWQKIKNYVKKHSETEEDIKRLKTLFENFSSKSVPEQYKEDQLLLDVWLEFIHLLIRAKDETKSIQNCFKFLTKHKIGRKNAQFYLEWAEFEQSQGNYEEAKNILSKGMDYGAQPEISLKLKLNIIQNLSNKKDEKFHYELNNDNNNLTKDNEINEKNYNKAININNENKSDQDYKVY
ncbi:hypothetical protein BCR32DRAFT_264024 [Anaeromyces robustus]|uniref:BUB1 N-terminal domain-containing protein n=1 Tax=Anaeromyces robustus TaxID=1754192 RepID=A0A1Y1XPV4_9FUNG|nr:hypothetical protein BCR32DRAFT_264024 [Anaeromyces robustus]|eukprot:ORX87789.1 hypothetical protein BCR32DRAFT_264024 [Anaeromyces robustus]